jgi:hypothetical protein
MIATLDERQSIANQSIHVWHRCHACGCEPILGRRYDCQVCPANPDSHLCERCHDAFGRGEVAHPPQHVTPPHPERAHSFVAVDGASPETFQPWIDVADASGRAPRVPDGFVVRPEFRSGRASYFGSYAFVAKMSRSRFVLTALHVLDELAKAVNVDCSVRNAAYTGAELPRLLEQVTLYDVFAARWMFADLGAAVSMLPLGDARMGEEEPYCQRDLAAFVADDSARLCAAAMAVMPPPVGEPVWLAVDDHQGGPNRTLAATMVETTERSLIFRFVDGDSTLQRIQRTSGAPLINQQGEVVGIIIGGGAFGNRRFGHALHVASIRRHLRPYL